MVRIGSNTVVGRPVMAASTSPYPKPKGEVSVVVDGYEAGRIDKATIIRFSLTAAAAFPKPSDPRSQPTDTSMENDEISILDLKKGHRFWQLPSAKAVARILAWMQQAKSASRGTMPPTFALPSSNYTTITDFRSNCEIYASALLLDIRSPPTEACSQLLDQISLAHLTLDMLKADHEVLPIDHAAMTRSITRFFELYEEAKYPQADTDKIVTYAKMEDTKLHHHFTTIERSRQVEHPLFSNNRAHRTPGGHHRHTQGQDSSNPTRSSERSNDIIEKAAKKNLTAAKSETAKEAAVKEDKSGLAENEAAQQADNGLTKKVVVKGGTDEGKLTKEQEFKGVEVIQAQEGLTVPIESGGKAEAETVEGTTTGPASGAPAVALEPAKRKKSKSQRNRAKAAAKKDNKGLSSRGEKVMGT